MRSADLEKEKSVRLNILILVLHFYPLWGPSVQLGSARQGVVINADQHAPPAEGHRSTSGEGGQKSQFIPVVHRMIQADQPLVDRDPHHLGQIAKLQLLPHLVSCAALLIIERHATVRPTRLITQ